MINLFLHAGMPEWSNGTDSKSVSSVLTKVRILLPALIFSIEVSFINPFSL